jgi:nicotinamide mononucleotide transporter
MTLQQIWDNFLTSVKATSWMEWGSTVAQIASVWYARQNKVWVYPTGIVGVLLAAYVYFFMANPPLYADAWLNIYYFIMSVYGWYNWVQQKDGGLTYPISWCSKKELGIGLGFFIVGWAVLYMVLTQTNSNTPVLDSLVSASAVTAMWWMAKRKIENWLAWIFSNIVAIPLNFYKGFMLFTLMYLLFLVLAAMGYQSWRKKLRDGQL